LQRTTNPGNAQGNESLVYWELFRTKNSLVNAHPGQSRFTVTNVTVFMHVSKFVELVSISGIVTS